jgi:hypothetical protein
MKKQSPREIKNKPPLTSDVIKSPMVQSLTFDGKLQYLKPLNKPQLFVSHGSIRSLTTSGQLQLARARKPTGRGVAIDKLVPFAENEIEQKLFWLIHETKPDLFTKCDDPLKALLQLRVLHIPIICRGLLHNEIKKNETGILWLGALGTYSVAFERTLLERMYRAARKAESNTLDSGQFRKWAGTALGVTVLTWFDRADEGCEYWLSRFDQWRDYAMRSLDHYLGRQSIDYRRMKGNMRQAAHLGILKYLDDFPEGRFADLLDGIRATSATHEMFRKNANKKYRTKPDNLGLKNWLIECWPLVLEYGWNYRELQLVANKRFEPAPSKGFMDRPRALKELCEKLCLKLGPIGRNRVGRAKANKESTLPPLSEVALKIDALEDHADWFWGSTDAGFREFNNHPRIAKPPKF